MVFDTIAAISTFPGEAGIGIVRLSGDDALEIISKIFKPYKSKDIKKVKSHTLHYGHIVDPETEEVYDEVLVSIMKKPNTYTREDIVEINCHGGIVVTSKILELVLKQGARLAEPGEFTKRAFLNGRIDLSQAEAVIDIIRAKTMLANRYAQKQLVGYVGSKIKEMKDKIMGLLVHLLALIDFPEEDVEELERKEILETAKEIVEDIDKLIASSESGRIIREGLKTAIIGKPNVGKSSLLNALLKENRAIVTDIPGTTRDIIEEYVNVKGIPIKLIDTAGIRDTDELVEKIGVTKSKEVLAEADLILFVLDASRELTKEDYEIFDILTGKNIIFVLNKIDLPKKIDEKELKDLTKDGIIIEVSTVEKIGLEELENTIYNLVFRGDISLREDEIVINSRHKEALINAKKYMESCVEAIEGGYSEDLITIDLNAALDQLGKITGETATEDLINEIFERFCVGK
ncbi:tRNA uridine-5-carboxymethylaminomethyl(34) synthesis GTPase MnmE [Thermoanaerobacter brockii subsp. lactiethylicus]|uniref:tRNA modification GTPase MnmE n=2 Tax=Thermoanaerobacter TaxID=1754 RepID=MNME_THEP3|nr:MULTISPECIES: tRNA uridine-5-carboxymethylaminomethyl(34) synthesis GTPase MnmE [Thermoanaerobacter]B0K8H9.1 RecName: Full=tRNA modification GTPase MnmE [Thermoanaerobacter pseudethanolicus ATCC 33223]ABY95911.1 tRNA modification GTPase TrmE [Thermoanaerobacter pseudethanolicus ATCC 33223]